MAQVEGVKAIEQTREAFRVHLKKIKHFQEAISLVMWDLRTGAPKKGRARRADVLGTLSSELFALQTSEELAGYLTELSDPDVQDRLDEITRAAVRQMKKTYDRQKKIPADLNTEAVIKRAQASAAWEEARAKSDFSIFQPHLEEMVRLSRQLIELYGYEGHPYNALLEESNPGLTVEYLDNVFADLRTYLVDLNRRIQQKGAPLSAMPSAAYDKGKLTEFAAYALREMGYDFEAGRIDETIHPFEIALNLGDVRVTTKYVPNDFRPTVFGTIHEGGHALYEQGIDPALENTPLCNGTDSGLHESQSRFWENMIARGLPYWERHYAEFHRLFPEQTAGVSLEQFHFTINEVTPGLIRIEADEATYNLHIILRYELEKALLEGNLQVADLPQAWREKMRELLGVEPQTDAEGVLQDVHWSRGGFGSFPSYTLGNIYAAQIRHAMLRVMPDLEQRVRQGRLLEIKAWLNENIHRYGKLLTASEIVQKVSGEPVSAHYLIAYLEEKFSALYNL